MEGREDETVAAAAAAAAAVALVAILEVVVLNEREGKGRWDGDLVSLSRLSSKSALCTPFSPFTPSKHANDAEVECKWWALVFNLAC
mmetsp:Transcript_15304/g.27229  ORF Transcript_15304/g.27229 Transcript_15304/m.27229 type:complete len:87 (-) Transcript_15304:671-931(-)